MTNETAPTIDIATAGASLLTPESGAPEAEPLPAPSPPPPPESPPPPPVRLPRVPVPPWLHSARGLLAVGVCLALAAVLQTRGLSWAASCAGWLDGSARTGTVAEDGLVAVALRLLTARGMTLAQTLSLWQFLWAGALLSAIVLVAWRLRGLAAAIVAVVVLLAWPTGRELTTTVGAETVLATTLVLMVQAGLIAWPRPLASALLLGTALAVGALVHPVGAALVGAALLAVLVLPLRRGVEPLAGVEPHEGLWPHAVTVQLLTGIAWGGGLFAAALGHGGIKVWWMRLMTEWRAPTVEPWVGGLGHLPLVGALTAWAVQVPVPLLVLGAAAAWGAARRPTDIVVLPAGVVLSGWIVLVWLGLPLPGHLDGVALLAPGTAILAAVRVVDLTRELWRRESSSARTGGVVLGFAILLALGADLRVAGRDRRSALGHIPGVLESTESIRPAILHPDDLGLLLQKPASTSVLPGHRGGEALANSLRRLHPGLAGFGSAFSCDRVLVQAGPGSGVEGLWAGVGKLEACSESGNTCLYTIRRKTP